MGLMNKLLLFFYHELLNHQTCAAKAKVFFIFCFTDFFRNKLGSEDEIKIKFIRTIFQLN